MPSAHDNAPSKPLLRKTGTWIARMANRPWRLTFVGLFKYGGAAAALGGPILVGIASWDSNIGFALGFVYFGGLAASFFGPLANQGGAWLEASGKQAIDRAHSLDVTAGLRLLNDAQRGAFDVSRLQDRLLKAMVTTARQLAPDESATVMSCLLVPQGDRLVLTAFSDHRDGRIPSASISFDEVEGAARAYREGRVVHVSDTARLADGSPLRGRSYRSVLCFHLGPQDKPAGVVTVDSTRPGHFADRLADLTVHMSPFVELLYHSVLLKR